MRDKFERESMRAQNARAYTLTNLGQVIANKNELARRGPGDAGGGGVINMPAIDPETGDFVEEALLWVPDRDAVGSVPVG